MKAIVVAVMLSMTAVAGCVESTGSSGSASTAPVQTLNGTVVSMRQVSTSNTGNQVAGAVAGGLIGGLVGNQFGNGKGREAMTVLGAGAGALAGSAAANNQATSREWTVRLDDGRTVAIVQNSTFAIGQRVQVIVQGNSVRMAAL